MDEVEEKERIRRALSYCWLGIRMIPPSISGLQQEEEGSRVHELLSVVFISWLEIE